MSNNNNYDTSIPYKYKQWKKNKLVVNTLRYILNDGPAAFFVCEHNIYINDKLYCTNDGRLFISYFDRHQYAIRNNIESTKRKAANSKVIPILEVELEEHHIYDVFSDSYPINEYTLFPLDIIHDNCRPANDADRLLLELEYGYYSKFEQIANDIGLPNE